MQGGNVGALSRKRQGRVRMWRDTRWQLGFN